MKYNYGFRIFYYIGFIIDMSSLTLCQLGILFLLFCRLLTFFQNLPFQKILSGTVPVCQTVWIPIRPDVLSGLIWVYSVCKNQQQTTKFAAGRQRVNCTFHESGHSKVNPQAMQTPNGLHAQSNRLYIITCLLTIQKI